MSHIVLVTNGLSSLLNSSLEVSRRLRLAGHRTTFVCPEIHADRVAEQGEQVVGLSDDRRFAGRLAQIPRPASARPGTAVAWWRARRRLRRDSIDSTELTDTIRGLEPDLLLIDVEVHRAVIDTASLGVPRMLAMNFFSIFRSDDLPPLSMSLPVPTDRIGRARVLAAWWWVRAGSRYGRLRHRLSRDGLGALVRPIRFDTVDPLDLDRLAKAVGLDLNAETDRSQWLRPFVFRDLPVLCYNAPEMELPHRPSPRLHYVGPMLRPARVERRLPADAAGRLDQLLSAGRDTVRGRPLIYCSLGTVWSTDRALVDRVLAVFERRQDWDLVLGMGGRLEEAELTAAPPNVLALDWAPQLAVLAEADCAIVHGGVNSLCEAVWFGVPLVVYSTGYVDQEGNAGRVRHHRLGVVGDRKSDSSRQLEANIQRALTDPGIRAGIATMQGDLRAYDPERSAEASEALLQVIDKQIAGDRRKPAP